MIGIKIIINKNKICAFAKKNNELLMNKNKIKIEDFSEHLFWDVDKTKLDIEKHQKYIVKYVLMYGLMNDWRLLLDLYGLKKISENAIQIRDLDKKSASFISTLSNIPLNKFKCYTSELLIKEHWDL